MVFEPAGLHICEIKRFKKPRLGKVQRQQVKDSLTHALKHKPVRWTLAIPTNPTVDERKWLTGVPQAIAGATGTSSADKKTAESLAVDWLPRNDLTSDCSRATRTCCDWFKPKKSGPCTCSPSSTPSRRR
jgi:hypothetical protein